MRRQSIGWANILTLPPEELEKLAGTKEPCSDLNLDIQRFTKRLKGIDRQIWRELIGCNPVTLKKTKKVSRQAKYRIKLKLRKRFFLWYTEGVSKKKVKSFLGRAI